MLLRKKTSEEMRARSLLTEVDDVSIQSISISGLSARRA
jgi:hypothetical protein